MIHSCARRALRASCRRAEGCSPLRGALRLSRSPWSVNCATSTAPARAASGTRSVRGRRGSDLFASRAAAPHGSSAGRIDAAAPSLIVGASLHLLIFGASRRRRRLRTSVVASPPTVCALLMACAARLRSWSSRRRRRSRAVASRRSTRSASRETPTPPSREPRSIPRRARRTGCASRTRSTGFRNRRARSTRTRRLPRAGTRTARPISRTSGRGVTRSGPRLRRGHSVEASRGGAAAATWTFGGGESRRGRGRDVGISWR